MHLRQHPPGRNIRKGVKPDTSRRDGACVDKRLSAALGDSRLSTTLLGDGRLSSLLQGDVRLSSLRLPSDFFLTFSRSSLVLSGGRLSSALSALLSLRLRAEKALSSHRGAGPRSSPHRAGGEPRAGVLFGGDRLSAIHLELSSLHLDDPALSGLLEHDPQQRNSTIDRHASKKKVSLKGKHHGTGKGIPERVSGTLRRPRSAASLPFTLRAMATGAG